MAKYTVTHCCGHDETVQLYGRSYERRRRMEWLESLLCPDCQREMDAKQNDEFEADYEGLVDLKGTEKQIAWGRTCRRKQINRFESTLDFFRRAEQSEEWEERQEKWREYFCQQDSAHWWIDMSDLYKAGQRYWEKYDAGEAKRLDAASMEPKVGDDAVVMPEEQTTSDIAEIIIDNRYVSVRSPKNRTIIDAVKKCGYSWHGKEWSIMISQMNGNAIDRAAEVGNALLLAGVPVAIYDETARAKAISGEYEPRQHRWISVSLDGRTLAVNWKHGDESMYYAALRLPHAKYREGQILVKPQYYAEILDFVSLNEFSITTAAKGILDKEEAAVNAKLRITPTAQAPHVSADGLKEILNSSRDILDELKEEE